MKAISLWQPWASFMADGWKTIETRGWFTRQLGDLVICSAQRRYNPKDASLEVWQLRQRLLDETPYGHALCVVELYACASIEFYANSPHVRELEKMLGNYAPGRYAWATRNLRKLKEPVPVKGYQGFFNLPPEVEAKVRAQLK